jgi:hypothetical protein
VPSSCLLLSYQSHRRRASRYILACDHTRFSLSISSPTPPST